ncbi:MAG: hypothetical protein WDZ41_00915 [Candidatus Babeliales bacterium]
MKLLSLKRKSLSLSLLIGCALATSMTERTIAATHQSNVVTVNVNAEIERIINACLFNFEGAFKNKPLYEFIDELLSLLEANKEHPQVKGNAKLREFVTALKSIRNNRIFSVVSKTFVKYRDLLSKDTRKRLINNGGIAGLKKRLQIKPVAVQNTATPAGTEAEQVAINNDIDETSQSKINQIVGYLALALEYAKMYNPFAKS